MGASQRDKGQRGERDFCAALSEHLGETIIRELGAARDGGPDILLGEHWAIEVKRGEKLMLVPWWAQACAQANKAARWPALAYRQNRHPWTVIVPLDVVMFRSSLWGSLNRRDLIWTAALSIDGFATVVREVGA